MIFVNYYEHPSNNTYMVYEFYREDMATEFRSLLTQNNLIFEEGTDEDDANRLKFLFGVKKNGSNTATKLNYLTYAKFRKPLISNVFLKYLLLIFVISIICLAVAGHIISNSN